MEREEIIKEIEKVLNILADVNLFEPYKKKEVRTLNQRKVHAAYDKLYELKKKLMKG